MKKYIFTIAATALLGFTAVYLASCGSSSSNGSGSSPAFSTGVISAKSGTNSISVNGVAYLTSGSSITMHDSAGHSGAELEEGMVVKVKGRMHDDGMHGEGAEIEYNDNLVGPLTSVSSGATSSLTALDQTILADVNTRLTPTGTTMSSLATLVATTSPLIEVSGMTDQNGVIHATFIEVKNTAPAAADAVELKGAVAGLNTGAKTFTIGGLTVNYGAASLQDFPAGSIANGLPVEVKSTFSQYSAGAHTLAAAGVEYKAESMPNDNDKAEVEGYVKNYDSVARTFTLSGIAVHAAGVASLPAIANGSIVEVEGTYAAGIMTATKVVLKTSL